MNRQEKEQKIEHWHNAFANVQGAVFANISGLTVAESTDLRRRFRDAQVAFEVVKNTLARRAVKGTDMDAAVQYIDGPTGVAWSDTDPTAAARVAEAFKKDVKKFEIRGGFATGRGIDAEGVKALSTMPSFEELRAQILGTIQSVSAKLLSQVNAPAQQLTGVVQARKEDLEKNAA